ncbi:MAG: S8 family peptidase [Deltaproteobacteria bacterium]|nr:S8 family peptidase [Deltaproteobacteria bacterium]
MQEATIEEIAYHAVLARLPIGAVRPLLEEAGRDAALVQCEQVQFFRAAGQMAGIVGEGGLQPDPAPAGAQVAVLGDPVVALFDGLPLQNHRRLAGRLVVDDPDGYEAQYPASERRHGTAMASLIVHGDLDAAEAALARRLYVRPILQPDARAWVTPRPETVPERVLVVDLIHRAVRRLFDGDGGEPPVAPRVSVINLSIGIRDRLFDGAMSPLARLLDWLAWKYRVLFVVSAGNHPHDIGLAATSAQFRAMSAADLQTEVLRAVAADARNRRLLSPAEAVNVITVGAVHQDASTGAPPPNTIQPFIGDGLPSVINAQGMGYRRAIKPDILIPGGRVVLREAVAQSPTATLQVLTQARPPGQRVAAPGETPGDLAYTWHSRGTSNATALATRAGSELYDVLEELRDEPGGELIDVLPRAVWLKVLLVHSASWGDAGQVLDQILRTRQNSRQFKEYVTRLLGYGGIEPERVRECTRYRVTALGGGQLQAEQAHVHRFPLPPGLSGRRGWRRLTITLAWLTPINAAHQSWRRADLWFTPPTDPLQIKRQQAEWRAVQRGTVQHEVLEGDRAAAFVDGDNLEVRVSCRPDAGALEDAVPYALATTLEVAEEIGVDIYDEVRVRVQGARVRVTPGS